MLLDVDEIIFSISERERGNSTSYVVYGIVGFKR